jgi:hypothetical protein
LLPIAEKNLTLKKPHPLLTPTMTPIKAFVIVILMMTIQSCGNKTVNSDSHAQSTKESAPVTSMTLLANFPIINLQDLIESITAAEFTSLIETGESQNWKFIKQSQNSFSMKNKQYDDNAVNFLAVHPDNGYPMLVVQQINAQVVVTQGWRYLPDGEQWLDIPLPAPSGKEFAAENVAMPDGYDDMSPYLNISMENEKMICSVNQWTFSHELENSYPGLESSILNSFFKYYYEIDWNGEEFTINRQQKKDYTAVFHVMAEVQTEDPNGPGLTEFDCHDGYSINASSELKPSGAVNYTAKNLLKDDGSAWSEGKDGDGANEWIQFTITGDFLIGSSYQLRNGYTKNTALWKANNRVKKFDILLNDQLMASVTLKDSEGYQSFSIIPPFITDRDVKKGDKVKFVIKEVYKGDKYEDTVISYFVTQGNCG